MISGEWGKMEKTKRLRSIFHLLRFQRGFTGINGLIWRIQCRQYDELVKNATNTDVQPRHDVQA